MNHGAEADFLERSGAALAAIEQALDAAGLDVERVGDGILELECDDGSKIVVNRHTAAREIWVAARSGGFHFRPDGERWVDTRSGETLQDKLSALIAMQAGVRVAL